MEHRNDKNYGYIIQKENVIAFTNARSKRMDEYMDEKSGIPNQ